MRSRLQGPTKNGTRRSTSPNTELARSGTSRRFVQLFRLSLRRVGSGANPTDVNTGQEIHMLGMRPGDFPRSLPRVCSPQTKQRAPATSSGELSPTG